MSSQTDTLKVRGVSLFESDWRIVENADDYGVGYSGTLRKIVRQWNDWRPHMMVDSRVSYDVNPKGQYITAQIPEE